MIANLPSPAQRATSFLQIFALFLFASTSQAIDFYAEALLTVNNEDINRSVSFPSDTGGVITFGASLIPQLSLEVGRTTENDYSARGEDESGSWETVSTVQGTMYGLRARHQINNSFSVHGKLGKQDLDLTMKIREFLVDFGPHHPPAIEDSADRYYYGGGAMLYLTPLVYLKADYIEFTKSSKFFSNSSAAFSLKGKYMGAGIGIEW